MNAQPNPFRAQRVADAVADAVKAMLAKVPELLVSVVVIDQAKDGAAMHAGTLGVGGTLQVLGSLVGAAEQQQAQQQQAATPRKVGP